MKEQHHDGLSGDDQSVQARLDQLHHEARVRRENERQTILQKATAAAEEALRRLNRGERVEAAADPAPESAESRPLRDVPDDELDLSSVPGLIEAGRRGLWPLHFYQPPEDYDAAVAAYHAEVWRAHTTGEVESPGRQLAFNESTGTYLSSTRKRGGAWSRPRVVAVSRIRPQQGFAAAARRTTGREARPGQRGRRARRHAATTLRDDGDGPGGESDPEPDPWPWLVCAHLSAAEAQTAADRIAVACRGSLTPLVLRQDVEAIWPHLRGDARSAALVAVYVRLPRVLREQHDRAAHAGTKAGAR